MIMILAGDETLIIDNSNFHWFNDREFTKDTLKSHVKFINECLKVRGYIYLNQLYESLYVKWEPHRHNLCFVYGEDIDEIRLVNTADTENGILIQIAFFKN